MNLVATAFQHHKRLEPPVHDRPRSPVGACRYFQPVCFAADRTGDQQQLIADTLGIGKILNPDIGRFTRRDNEA
jgi:hypothetical protein